METQKEEKYTNNDWREVKAETRFSKNISQEYRNTKRREMHT